LIGGKGNDTLWGGSGSDTFKWVSGDTGNDVIKDFNVPSAANADKDVIDLSDLLHGVNVTQDTLSNYVSATTDATGTLLSINTSGNVKTAAADVTIHVDNVSWNNDTVKSLVYAADPTIKVDHH
jgi:hypothetical protein